MSSVSNDGSSTLPDEEIMQKCTDCSNYAEQLQRSLYSSP